MNDADRILALRPEDVCAGPITVARLRIFAPACDAETLAPALQAAADRFGINTVTRLSHWLAQLHTESRGFTRTREVLTYSAARLCEVWPSRFPTIADAALYANNPKALACKVYGGRMGNNLTEDGFTFCGRGYIQITGRDNYAKYGPMIGEDLIANPDRAAEPDAAALIAGAFWRDHGLNAYADAGDIRGITRAINGGETGLADRAMQVSRAKAALAS